MNTIVTVTKIITILRILNSFFANGYAINDVISNARNVVASVATNVNANDFQISTLLSI